MLEIDPNDAFCLYGLAHEHAKHGDQELAVEYYQKTIAVDPAYIYAYYHKAKSLEAIDRLDEAVATLRVGLAHAGEAKDEKAMREISEYLGLLDG